MGTLFQLIIVGILYFIAASIFGLALISIAWMITLFKRQKGISIIQFFWLPIKLAPYLFVVIILNILICEYIRNVDPPLTDYWSLHINGKLTMGAIDIPDKWYLWPSRNGGESIISDIVLVGLSDKAFYGSTETGQYFIYWLKSNRKSMNLSQAEFETEIKEVESHLPKLKHPFDLYHDKRDFGDLITFLLMLLYPLYRFYNVCNTFWNTVNKKRDVVVGSAT